MIRCEVLKGNKSVMITHFMIGEDINNFIQELNQKGFELRLEVI